MILRHLAYVIEPLTGIITELSLVLQVIADGKIG